MAIQLTEFARRIFEELQRLKLMLFGVLGDDRALNHRLTEGHEKAKTEALADLRQRVTSFLPSGANPDDFISYSGENPADANAEYSAYLERALAEMALCRAVDCYHWYLRQVVLLILDRDVSLVRRWASALKITNESKIAAFERGEGRDKLLIEWFRGKEWKTRELVHEHWRMPLGENLGVLVKVRNCTVHQLGEDADGALAPLLAANSRLDLTVEAGRVVIGYGGADTAIGVVISDISIIDQCLVRYFSLPAQPYQPPKLHRSYG